MKPFFNGAILLLAGFAAVNADAVLRAAQCKYGCMPLASLPASALDAATRRGEDFVADTRLQSAARRLCGVPTGRYLLPFFAHPNHPSEVVCQEGERLINQNMLALQVSRVRSLEEHFDRGRTARSDEFICYVNLDALWRLDAGNLIARMFRYSHEYSRTVVLPCVEPAAVYPETNTPIPFRFQSPEKD